MPNFSYRLLFVTIFATVALAIAIGMPRAAANSSSSIVEVDVGPSASCARAAGGNAFCWGRNSSGVANPQEDISQYVSSPTLISGLPPILQMDVGGVNACAVTASHGLTCWGEKEIGPGTSQAQMAPFLVPGLESGVASVSVSGNLCVVTTATDVLCGVEQEFDLQPVCLNASCSSTLTGVDSVSASPFAVCASVAGGVKCWGQNVDGVLGDGTITDSDYPVDVCILLAEAPSPCIELLSGVQDVSVGGFHACALITDGTIYCWGSAAPGQFGQVEGIHNAIGVSVGAFHTCALLNTGSVECWGFNNFGEVGIGHTSFRELIAPVIIPDEVINLDAQGRQTCAVGQNGDAYCWGRNDQGQLGEGPNKILAPRLVPGLGDDSDSDGVPDGVDACPDEAGSLTNGGCPFPPSVGGLVEALVTEGAAPDVAGSAGFRPYLLMLVLLGLAGSAIAKLRLTGRR